MTLASDLVIICDEEGKLKGKAPCCTVCGVDLVGTIIFAGVEGDEFSDLPADYQTMKRLFPQLWDESEVNNE